MTCARVVVAAVCLACVAVGCNKTFCNGIITCGLFDVEKCASVPGCTPGPACEITAVPPKSCAAAKDQAGCAAPMCSWIDDACVPFCRTLTTEAACNGFQPTEYDPDGRALWSCAWTQCLGKPEKSCSKFSVEMCPADLGCRVETSNGFPDN